MMPAPRSSPSRAAKGKTPAPQRRGKLASRRRRPTQSQLDQNELIRLVESPPFLHLFEPSCHDQIRKKLGLYSLRFGTKIFIKLRPEMLLHLIEFSALPGFPAVVRGHGKLNTSLFLFIPVSHGYSSDNTSISSIAPTDSHV